MINKSDEEFLEKRNEMLHDEIIKWELRLERITKLIDRARHPISGGTFIPLGAIHSCANQPGNNWLLCDGSKLNVKDYPELYKVLGKQYGGNRKKFNIPNMMSMVTTFTMGATVARIQYFIKVKYD